MSLFGIFGGKKADSSSAEHKGLNEVDKLLHRIESVTLIADRRDGLRALRKVAREYRVEIGAHGMDILLSVLAKDSTDQELVAITLEILCIVMSDADSVESELSEGAKKAKAGGQEKVENKDPGQSLGAQFTEIFLKKSEHLALLLVFVKEFQFQVRWPAVRLLCIMANNSPKTVQDCLLTVGGGITNLMDLLTDNREIIRNDGVLLLYFITRNNPSLQKIVAFSKALDTLLDMVRDEGCSEGGVVVEDCLLLLSNLLTNNASNIKLFKEDGCISKLCAWYANDKSSSASWSDQRKINAISMLGIIRSLVSPSLSSQLVKICQDAVNKCGLLVHVCDILMTPGVPLTVLVQALNTVAECIRGNRKNQEDFSAMEAPLNPPRPALAILLLSMFNDRQVFNLRLAVLYVLKCVLYKNESMQISILHSINPDGSGPTQHTLGQLLGGAMFSPDSLNQWCSAIAFLHCISENRDHKNYLLKVEFHPSPTLPSSTVMQQCGVILRENHHLRSKIAALQLLSVWLSECPQAVSAFLNIPQITMLLLTQILDTATEKTQRLFQGLCAFLFSLCIHYDQDEVSRRQLVELVRNRIGFDTCRDKIAELPRHENFVKASQSTDPAVSSLDDLFLDHDFVRFFKSSEGKIHETLDPHYEERINDHREKEAGALNQQREFLQAKDNRIAELEAQLSYAHSRITESSRQTDDLRRRSEVLTSEMQSRDAEIDALQQELHRSQTQLQNQSTNLFALQEENAQTRQQLTSKSEAAKFMQENVAQYQGLMQEVDQLRALTTQQQQQISSYYTYFESLQQGGDLTGTLVMEKEELAARVGQLDSLLYSWQGEANRLQEEVASLQTQLMDVQQSVSNQHHQETQKLDSHPAGDALELSQLRIKYETLNAEHADLLELLTDNDDKIRLYKYRLRQLGESVSDDDA